MVAADIPDSVDRQTQQSEIASVKVSRSSGQARLRIGRVTGRPSGGPAHQDRPRWNDDRSCGSSHCRPPAAFLGSQELHDATRKLRRIAGIGVKAILRGRLHAGHEVEVDEISVNHVDRLCMDHMRRYDKHRRAKAAVARSMNPKKYQKNASSISRSIFTENRF